MPFQRGPLSEEELDRRLRYAEEKASFRRENRLAFFKPYPKQMEFFGLGATKRERLLMAGNQVGKSEGGAYETACHLTGLYPPWWVGKRFAKPVRGWMAGESGVSVRDIAQRKLFGPPGIVDLEGTGMVPKALILSHSASHSATDAYDTVRVKHITGGVSEITSKTYEMARGKWQGPTLDFVWPDEEAPPDLYSEGLARLTGDGIIYTTFTPLLGYTQLVNRFLRDDSEAAKRDRGWIKMGLRHAAHFSDDEKAKRLAGYPAHERDARENGDPMLGEGAVFEEVMEVDLATSITLSQVPAHWVKLWAIDFGINHPFAAVLLAWDRDADVIYVLHAIKITGGIPPTHAAPMKAVAAAVPVAWPHDGTARDKGSGTELSKIYKDAGLAMLGEHATHASGGYSTEAGIMELLQRMREGRFKVAAHLSDWFDEFRGYHRKDGQIVKLNDDLLSATRIGVMARRFARPVGIGSKSVSRVGRPAQIAEGTNFNVFG